MGGEGKRASRERLGGFNRLVNRLFVFGQRVFIVCIMYHHLVYLLLTLLTVMVIMIIIITRMRKLTSESLR